MAHTIIVKELNKIISAEYRDDQIFNNKDIFEIYKKLHTKIKSKKNTNIEFNDIYKYLIKSFINKESFELCKNIKINSSVYIPSYNIDEVKIPAKYKPLHKQFYDLFNQPQPEQKSVEWFAYRHKRITASDAGSAIGDNPYETINEFIVKKCDPNHKFLDNDFVYHGKKFEDIATKLYEHIYNIKVYEFGCLPHPEVKYLGNSPDGICSEYTLDNKFSGDMFGTMLEIKCPYVRKITTSGTIDGEICPHYYHCQVQLQLECCKLEKCDFWQCKIIEYPTYQDYILDEIPVTKHTKGTKGEPELNIDTKWTRGAIIELIPNDILINFTPKFKGDKKEFYCKFIYPPHLDMSTTEYQIWITKTLSDFYQSDDAKTFSFRRVVYWKITQSHNVKIYRDLMWFKQKLPVLEDSWNKILYYREHQEEFKKFQEETEKNNKKFFMNTANKSNTMELLCSSHDFLSKDFYDTKKQWKNDNIKKDLYDVDFVD